MTYRLSRMQKLNPGCYMSWYDNWYNELEKYRLERDDYNGWFEFLKMTLPDGTEFDNEYSIIFQSEEDMTAFILKWS